MSYLFGLFDSGIGGLTVLKRVIERHGDVSCLYLADTARLPYGQKTPSEIRAIAAENVHWLVSQNVSAILVACNTTNSLAMDVVKKTSGEIPVFGLLNCAAEMISKKKVGVLATSATISSNAYKNHIEASKPGTIVYQQACPSFVPMIEAGLTDTESVRAMAIDYLKPLLEKRVQEIILGCSHYPFLHSLLLELIPKDVRLLDPAIKLSQFLDSYFEPFMPKDESSFSPLRTEFYATSHPDNFAHKVSPYLGFQPNVQEILLQINACFS